MKMTRAETFQVSIRQFLDSKVLKISENKVPRLMELTKITRTPA